MLIFALILSLIPFFIAYWVNRVEFGRENWPETFPLIKKSKYLIWYGVFYGVLGIIVYGIFLYNNPSIWEEVKPNPPWYQSCIRVLIGSILTGLSVRGIIHVSLYEGKLGKGSKNYSFSLARVKNMVDSMSYGRISAQHDTELTSFIERVMSDEFKSLKVSDLKIILIANLAIPRKDKDGKKGEAINTGLHKIYLTTINGFRTKISLTDYFIREFGIYRFELILEGFRAHGYRAYIASLDSEIEEE